MQNIILQLIFTIQIIWFIIYIMELRIKYKNNYMEKISFNTLNTAKNTHYNWQKK